MGNVIDKARTILKCNLIQFIKINYLSSNVKRNSGCYLYPFKGTRIRIDPSARLILNGKLYLNASKFKGSNAESYFSMDDGSKLTIHGNTRINYGSTVHLCENAVLETGSFTTNVGINFQIKHRVTIGKDCMFGRNAFIFDSGFHPTGMSENSLTTNTKEVVIGNHVWIGANSFITAGAVIGDGSIIGSGTYITGEVQPFSTIVRAGDQPTLIGNMWARTEDELDIKDALTFYKEIKLKRKDMTDTDTSFQGEIIEILNNHFPTIDFNISDQLVSDHIIDSLSLISIVTLLEHEYKVKIPYYEISPNNFDSTAAMSNLISRLIATADGDRDDLKVTRSWNNKGIEIKYIVEPQNTLIEYVKIHSEKNPEKIAVISNGESFTYSKLYELARKYGSYLSACGIKRGERIVVKSIQSIDYIIIYLGAHYAGAVITTVEKASSNEKIIEIAEAIDAKAIICDSNNSIDEKKYRFINSKNVQSDCSKNAIIGTPFPQGEDSADILFTTGTTGQSKGVELSHAAVIAGAENIAFGCQMKKDTVLVVPNPLSHSNAIKNLGACLITGCTFYVLDGITDLRAYFAALDCDYGKVATVLPPAAIRTIFQLAKEKLAEYVDKLDYLMAATAPLPEPDRETLRQILPKTRLYNHYGCSESSSICIYDFNKYSELRNCVGKAMPHSEVFFVDENRQVIESSKDNIGLLAVRGDATMKGYFREPELTSEIKDGNVIYTKDMGYKDEDGFVFILGRNDDIINVGGLKVSPLDIEAVALSYPGVSDCICIGVPDKISGQALKLLVVPGTGFNEGELNRVLSAKLEGYRFPRQIEIVEKVERTYNGKINRKAYRG